MEKVSEDNLNQNIVNDLFFELIRVAVGQQDTLSRVPTNAEWEQLYAIVEKHSLIGVCFVALQRLGANADDGFFTIGMGEMLYLNWMAVAASVQNKNEVVYQQCVDLQTSLYSNGIRSCILKGQGVAAKYGDLSLFRQSGDIDIYVEGGRRHILQYLHNNANKDVKWDYIHVCPHLFKDTTVEIHYRITVFRNLLMNYRLQKFLRIHNEELFSGIEQLPSKKGMIVVPSSWMNLFYLLQHSYRHLLSDGLGMRQVMDYYYVLRNANLNSGDLLKLKSAAHEFRLEDFASGLMWILEYVFYINPEILPWQPNKSEGEFMLAEIIQSGNFGHKDKRFGNATGSKMNKLSSVLRRSFHLLSHYPSEVLWTPFYYIWHFFWKRLNK